MLRADEKINCVLFNLKSRLTRRKKKDESERFRQVNIQLLEGILMDNKNKNTAKSEKKVHKILVKYLEQTQQDIDYCKYTVEELDKMLASFWFTVSPEKEGTDHYTVSSLHHIRYAIKRLLQNSGKEFDITTDSKFSHSQCLFKEACKELKRKGYGHVRYTDAIKLFSKNLHLCLTSVTFFTKKSFMEPQDFLTTTVFMTDLNICTKI